MIFNDESLAIDVIGVNIRQFIKLAVELSDYLNIKSDNTIESWTNRGLEQIYRISAEENTLFYKTFSHAIPEWEGEELELEILD